MRKGFDARDNLRQAARLAGKKEMAAGNHIAITYSISSSSNSVAVSELITSDSVVSNSTSSRLITSVIVAELNGWTKLEALMMWCAAHNGRSHDL